MARVIAVTPNPALDLTIDVEKLHPEGTHRVEEAQRRLGGKGINVASIAAEQGYPAAALGPLSGTDLEAYAGYVQPSDTHITPLPPLVSRHFSPTMSSLRSTWAIHERDTGTTYILNEPGRVHPSSAYDDMISQVHSLTVEDDHSVVTVSGSFPPGTPQQFVSRLIGAAQGNGAKTIIDTSGEFLREACLAKADLVKPNSAELLETTGLPSPREGAEVLLSLGAQAVLTSLGPKGLLLTTSKQSIHAYLDHQVLGNPTGAGDAVVAAVATGLAESLDAEELLRKAIAWSAAAVTCPVAGQIGNRWDIFLDRVTFTYL